MPNPPILPVLLAGGKGARLAPLSSDDEPKQFMPFPGQQETLFAQSCARLGALPGCQDVLIVTTAAYRVMAEAQAARALPASITPHVLIEPCARNTAAASLFAAFYAHTHWAECVLWIMPTDHYIPDHAALCTRAMEAATLAQAQQAIALLGITPSAPSSRYGYITAEAGKVTGFVEKPEGERLLRLFAEGKSYWNSGMFFASPATLLQEAKQHQKLMYDTLAAPLDETRYANLPSLPLDKAIIEHSTSLVMLPFTGIWSDMGSWESLWEVSRKDAKGNGIIGKKSVVAAEGLENLVIVETEDTIFIGKKAG
jgi:mannose-1-phosphate guanylyltransferase/mannose-6-phosphate isomerase